MSHPPRFAVCCTSPADFDNPYEAVTFAASDGAPLSGWYIPSQNGAAVIMVHANNGNRTGVLYHADVLANQGYGVLMFDVRGYGDSEANLYPLPRGGMAEDVLGAVAYLQSRSEVDRDRIGALGLSMGASIVLRAAAASTDIQAVVADGASESSLDVDEIMAFADLPPLAKAYIHYTSSVAFGLVGLSEDALGPQIRDVIDQIAPRPVLLISAGTEAEININRVFYANAGEPKTLWELPDAGHIQAIFSHAEEYHARLLTFFEDALLQTEGDEG
jgi:pimeloyl-ACP methyl ester carboxylesterase